MRPAAPRESAAAWSATSAATEPRSPQQGRERRLHLSDRQLRHGEPTQPRLQIVTDELFIQPACRRPECVPRRQPHIQPLAYCHQGPPGIHIVTQPEPPRTFRRSPRRESAALHTTTTTVPASRQLNREIPPSVTALAQPRTCNPQPRPLSGLTHPHRLNTRPPDRFVMIPRSTEHTNASTVRAS
jgi:hypothetical protein